MSKRKPQSSTRNVAFNSYESYSEYDMASFLNSVTTVSATKKNPNIKLLGYDDYVMKNGQDIINDAENNHTLKDLGIDVSIKTDEIEPETDYYIYGSPYKMVLDNQQQYNNCGIDATLNTLVLAGIKTIKSQTKTETDFTKQMWSLGLADDEGKIGVFDYEDGGTAPPIYQEIFEYYGINSEVYYPDGTEDPNQVDPTYIVDVVKKGGVAIVGVCSDYLWYGTDYEDPDITIDHAVLVTGVVYDTKQPADATVPVGLYIHDTGGWITRYMDWTEFLSVSLCDKTDLEGKTGKGVFATVVSDPIKKEIFNINATGTNDDNIIYGNNGDNVIKGLGGSDIIYGGAGNDKIYGGAGDDFIWANEKSESPILVGRNVVYGGAGNDKIYGGGYNDTLQGDAGNDEIYGYGGIDVISGGKGNDIIYGGDGEDRLSGDAGDDEIHGGDGIDTINGGAGNDKIYGEAGDDRIECGKGNDVVYYEKGNGYDTVSSSGGSVTFSLSGENMKASELAYEVNTMKNSFKIGFYNDDKTEDSVNAIEYKKFYNYGKNKCQTAYLTDNQLEKYRIFITNSKGKIGVKDLKGNNLFFALNSGNNTISTSSYNDIVYMFGGDDTITYTTGEDYYYSLEGNNTYISAFDENTKLSIMDNIELQADGEDIISPSENDVLKINSDKLSLFFDIDFSDGGKTTVNSNMFLLSENVFSQEETYKNIVNNSDVSGLITVTDYFKSGEKIALKDYDGNGCIEHIQTLSDNTYSEYNIDARINAINNAVQSWYSEYGEGYTSVYNAVKDEGNEHLAELIAAYTT